MFKKFIAVLIAMAMLLSMAACKKNNGGQNVPGGNSTGSGIDTPSVTSPGVAGPNDPISSQGAISTGPAIQTGSERIVLDSYPFDDTREEKLERWAERAAYHNRAIFGYSILGVPYEVPFEVVDIRSLDLGYAGGVNNQTKWLEIYELTVAYYPEDVVSDYDVYLDPADWSFDYEEQIDGGVIPDLSGDSEAWKYFAVYTRGDNELVDGVETFVERTLLAGFFSESDCDYIHEEITGETEPLLDKFYSVAAYAVEWGDARIDYDIEHGIGEFGPYVPADKDYCIFFDGSDIPHGLGLRDQFTDVIGITPGEKISEWIEEGYEPVDAWMTSLYEGIGCVVYFNGITGSNIIYSIETDRADACTYRGLRVGDDEARARELYPELISDVDPPAYIYEQDGASYWWMKQDLSTAYGPAMILEIADGIVSRIGMYYIYD